jgi:hypothetical protein
MQSTDETPWAWPWPESSDGLAPCIALPITESLRERLRRLRRQQLADHSAGSPRLVCALFYEEDVVCIRAFGGHAAYLGLDGRVSCENYGEGLGPEVLSDPRDVASIIVRFAGDLGIPELIDLLPTRPDGAVACRLCKGSRWESSPPEGESEGGRWCCRRCRGLGWTLA